VETPNVGLQDASDFINEIRHSKNLKNVSENKNVKPACLKAIRKDHSNDDVSFSKHRWYFAYVLLLTRR